MGVQVPTVAAFVALLSSIAIGTSLSNAEPLDRTSQPSVFEERPTLIAAHFGATPLGNVGVEYERSITHYLAFAVGIGAKVDAFPNGDASGRASATARLRRAGAQGAFGAELGVQRATHKLGGSHSEARLVGATGLVSNGYYERRLRTGFTWRLLIGATTRVADGRCEDSGTGECPAPGEGQFDVGRLALHAGFAVGAAF